MTNRNVATSANAMAEMRLLLRYLQYEGGLSAEGRATLDELSDALDVTRDQLNRYLGQLGNRTDLEERHKTIARSLYILLKDRRDLPPHIRTMLSDIYGEGAFPSNQEVVTSDRVIQHRSLVPQIEDPRKVLKPFEGLNVLVRPANESVPKPTETDPLGRTQGWSVSVLNIPPIYVQEGDHHPLFKLRQIGQNRNELTVEGIVIVRNDRIVLQGMTLGESKSFQAILTLSSDRMSQYRVEPDQRANSVAISGLFSGVSSGGSAFGCLVEAFAIPDSTLPRNATNTEKAAFMQRYEQAKKAAGVRDIDATIEALEGIGILTTRETLMELFTRSRETPILSAF